MKLSQLVLTAAGLMMCTGCSEMVSLHALVGDPEAIFDARLTGVWTLDDDVYIVRQDGNGYNISCLDKNSAPYKLKAKLLKAGDAGILDLTPASDDAFRIAAHTPLRVWVEGATLRMAFLDSKWLREHAGAQLATQEVDGRTLITATQEELTRFLVAYGADERAYGNPTVLTRQQ